MSHDPDQHARDVAALEALVAKYDLRWDEYATQPYPATLDCVGEGWVPLLDELVRALIKLGWDGRVAQVKEKLRFLRFYIGPDTEKMFATIHRYEHRSGRICDQCGKAGQLRRSRPEVVRCDQHAPTPGPKTTFRIVCAARVLMPEGYLQRRS